MLALALALLTAACTDRALDLPANDPSSARDLSTADASVDDLSTGDAARRPVRLLAPLSSSTVTSRRPTLHWQGGGPGVVVALCADRACTQPLGSATVDTTGTRARVDAPLRPGPVFWRVLDGAESTPTWQLWVGKRDAAVDNSYGSRLDVNGDGFSDVAIGELGGVSFDKAHVSSGAVHVFSGGAAGLATKSFDIASVESASAFQSDFDVASAGDLDGDGFCDLVVGSPRQSAVTATAPGVAHVYLGSSGGLRLDNAITLTGPDASYQFPRVVLGAGDVDGDGYGDLLITSIAAAKQDAPSYLYFGGPAGVSNARMQTLPSTSPDAGMAAASGDFNGDGYGDVILGAPDDANGDGRVQVYLGGPSGLGAPTALAPPDSKSGFGRSVATADVDGDGYCDAIVTGQMPTGAYVFRGGPSGLTTTPIKIAWPVNGNLGFGDFGVVAGAGDIDADGRDDLLLGDFSDVRFALYRSGPGTSTIVALPIVGVVPAGAGDVDGDGFDDALVGQPGSPHSGGLALVFAGGVDGLKSTDYHQAVLLPGPKGLESLFGFSVAGLR